MSWRMWTRDQVGAAGRFMAANARDESDFTLKLGRYQWNVCANIMSKASRHFDVLCNGPSKESQDRVVELFDDNPFDIARLLQFIYTDNYDRELGDDDTDEAVSLGIFLPKEGISPEESVAEKARTQFEVDKALYALAEKYDVTHLQEFIADRLVDELKPYDFHGFMEDFTSVFKVIDNGLHKMPWLNEFLVRKVYQHILAEEAVRPPYGSSLSTPPFLERSEDDERPELEQYQKQLKECIKGNGNFALEMVLASHRINANAFDNFKWSKTRVKSCLYRR